MTDKCFNRLDNEVNFVNNNSIHVIIHGKPVEIKCKFKITQMDSKALKDILGLRGSFCKQWYVLFMPFLEQSSLPVLFLELNLSN